MNYLKQKQTHSKARFLKAGIDANQHLSTWEKYMEKCAVSNQIADPIDREAELKNDEADYAEECARNSVHRLALSPLIAFLLDSAITFRAEACKQQIARAVEDSHSFRDDSIASLCAKI